MTTNTRTALHRVASPLPPVTGRTVLDPADLCQLVTLAARRRSTVRHVLLAAVVSLLRRHEQFGPVAISLDLSASFPSAFPDASGDIFPFACPADVATPFAHVVRSVAAAEAAALAASPRRTFADELIPYRLRVTVPAGWGQPHRGTPTDDPDAGPPAPRTFTLGPQADEGLVIAPASPVGATEDPHVTAVFRRLRPLLEGAAAAPDTPVSRLPVVTPGERHELFTVWNDTRTPLPPFRCVHHLAEAQVARTPHVTAVRFGDRSMTYQQLDVMANRLARELQSRGVGPDSLVGICLDRGPEMLVALLATLKAGGAYLPLDPACPPDRLAFMLDDSDAAVVITRRPVIDHLGLRARSVLCLDEEPAHLYADVPATPPDCRATPDSLCYVIYASGSTGIPKGVQVPHRAFVNFLTAMADAPGISDRDVLLAATTLSSDIAGLDLFLPLTVGARINLLPREVATDGPALRRALELSDATILQVTPATWRMLINAGWQGTPGLRMFCGGEAMTLDLARQLLARGAELWNMYGPTETTVYSTIHRVDGDASPVPIGSPVANTRCYILDANLQPVPAGLTGELFIAGDGLARGYLNRPDLTASRFLPDPFAVRPGSRMYRTGDVCRHRPDGQIEYLGRNDHQAKANGSRIDHIAVTDDLLQLGEDSPAALAVRSSLIVPLQPSGTRPPLFCLPGLGGHCSSFRSLIPFLGSDQPLYGINLPTIDSAQEPGRDVRAIASRLLDQIRAVQPTGPYYLAGYSFGGVVAYEMARQLRAADQSAPVVILIDAFGPGYPHVHGPIQRLFRHASRLLVGSHRTATAINFERGYEYPPYSGHVALFRSTVVPDEVGRSFTDAFNGWDKVVASPVELYSIPAGHLDLLRPAQVEHWGPELRDLLDRVQSA